MPIPRLALGERFARLEEPITAAVVGLGPVGRECARALARKPWIRLVAGVDVDPELAGASLAEAAGFPHAGLEDPGVRIAASLEEALPEAGCDVAVHATVSALERAVPQLEPLLARGISVVSTCEELSFPLGREPAERLDRAAREGGATLLGTGINPGFLLDTLPATLAVVCQHVERISALRIVDAGLRREPLQRKVGAGLDAQEWERLRQEGRIRHVGLPESARLLAAALGWDDVVFSEETIEPVLAERDLATDVVRVRVGQAAGVRQLVTATRGGREVIRLELAMYVGATDPRDAVEIRGTPDVSMQIPGGVHGDRATAAVVANMVPRVHAAPPGLVTMAELPVGASF